MTHEGVMPRRMVENVRVVNVYALVAMLFAVALVLSVCVVAGVWELAVMTFAMESALVYRITKSMEEHGYIKGGEEDVAEQG